MTSDEPVKKLPSSYKDFGEIKNVREITPQDIKKLDDIFNYELERKKKNLNFNIKRCAIYGIFVLVIIYYILSFLSILKIINCPKLEDYFPLSISVLISSLISFLLGYYYPKG